MPVTDDPELSPLAVLAVNSLRETYKQRGPHAFDEAALILFMAVGSIIARTRGREGLHVQWKPSALRWRRAQMGLATPHRLRSTEPARLTSFVTDCCDGELAHLRRQKISDSKNLKCPNDFAPPLATRVKPYSRKRSNFSLDDGAKEGSFPTPEAVPCPLPMIQSFLRSPSMPSIP